MDTKSINFKFKTQKQPKSLTLLPAGFDAESAQKACCGTGGDYNFSLARMCGAPRVPVCPNPSQVISWDGVHLTQAAYQIMAGWLIHDILPKLQCSV